MIALTVIALSLAIAAIVCWDSWYRDKAPDHARRHGRLDDPSLLQPVSPLGREHIALTGGYAWNSGKAQHTNARPLNLRPPGARAWPKTA